MASVNPLPGFLPFIGLCLCVFLHGGIDAGVIDGGDRHEMTHIEYSNIGQADMTRKACELAQARGYKCEEHEVETEDGYILTLHHLPLKDTCGNNDKVLLFGHSFLGSSTHFLINNPDESLGYLFSDACYDVWLLNVRGNTYSLKHNTYTVDDAAYWKFSFDEMAKFDLPASVDYILNKTNQRSLYYIGHSQGTTMGFEAFSENEVLAKKIRFFGALAPVGYASHAETTVTNVYTSVSDQTIYLLHGHKSFYGHDWKRDFFVKTTCNNRFTRAICVKIGESLGGTFSKHLIKERIPIYYMHTPAGSSVQNLVHWVQLLRGNTTRKYAYATPEENYSKYGSSKAPELKFSQVKVPVGLFVGGKDILSVEKDTDHLASDLPNVVAKIRIPDYSHLDFIYATNAAKTIFRPLSVFMENY